MEAATLERPSSGRPGRDLHWRSIALQKRRQRGKRKRDALDVVSREEAGLVARRLLVQYRPVPVGRPLDDLLSKNPLQLGREPASHEEEMATLADSLHRFGDGRLDVDFGQDFHEVGVRDEEVRRG